MIPIFGEGGSLPGDGAGAVPAYSISARTCNRVTEMRESNWRKEMCNRIFVKLKYVNESGIVRTDYGIAFGHAFGRAMGLPLSVVAAAPKQEYANPDGICPFGRSLNV